MKLSFRADEPRRPAYELLAEKGVSRLLVKRIRLYGQLLVNGLPARMKDAPVPGDLVEAIYLDDHTDFTLRPDHGIRICYEDPWLLVCEKPAGLVTHPSWQHMDDSLIQRLSEKRLHPVTRLDRETSGLILIAKNGFSHHALAFSGMVKKYIAFVYGEFSPKKGTIDAPIERSGTSIMLREVREDGKRAVTHYETLGAEERSGLSRVLFTLETGRCHQIRVHCLHSGHPIVADGLYGVRSVAYPAPKIRGIENEEKIDRQALHAAYLSFIHPIFREELVFESPLPEDMKKLEN